MRMLMNNLDPDVAEDPDRLVVYGGTGRAARSWEAFYVIIRSLRELVAHPKVRSFALEPLRDQSGNEPLAARSSV